MSRRALADSIAVEPYEFIPTADRSKWNLGSVPAAVLATIGTPLPSPATGSVAGGNVTLNAGITPFDAIIGPHRKTLLEIKALPLTITDALAYLGTKIFSFPKGRIAIASVVASFAVTTTSTLASTINASGSLSIALGTATASNIALTSTMVDLLPLVACTTSATINVPSATVSTALAATAQFDGTGTSKDMFLNLAFPTNTDIDADGTVLVDGFIEINWNFLGITRLVNGA